jgi:alkanesulfonate monooxygenase SsuD/methylene tetrahydromethanopterin reductase-like flavin-dependent oxidoreductase (luciferase family)
VPLVALYRDVAAKAGHDPDGLPIAISSNGFVAETSQAAADIFYPSYAYQMNQLGRERGWNPMTRGTYESQRAMDGALAIGSPERLVDRILHQHALFGHQRFLLQMSVGTMPHADVMRSIELYGTKVAPEVRRALADTTFSSQSRTAA